MLVPPVPQARGVVAEQSTFESAADLGKLEALGYLLVDGKEPSVGLFDRDRDLRCGRIHPVMISLDYPARSHDGRVLAAGFPCYSLQSELAAKTNKGFLGGRLGASARHWSTGIDAPCALAKK